MDTESHAATTQKLFEDSKASVTPADEALLQLLTLDYQKYLEKERDFTERFIALANLEATKEKYPLVRRSIDDYISSARGSSDPTAALSAITGIIVALADSNKQSRASRSGSSLMHHLAYIFEKHGLKPKVHFQREYKVDDKCKLDFFLPNKEMYRREPKNCCAIACQTTSNDRFRLTFAQMPSDTRNRACTAIGSPNFGPSLGPDSLTDNKLKEARDKGVKFVIFSHAIDDRLEKSGSVMSYQELIDELYKLSKLWE